MQSSNSERPSRVCFVIMPFGRTTTCSETEWTEIFDEVFKPSVEGANLGYICRRSTATRGNIVKEIIEDLDRSYVVLADLTDRNPNVFYELGVRHSLGDRTVILAQRREDIPFDLQGYANHIYGWRTQEERALFSEKLQALLREIELNPGRSDNPVSDFLRKGTYTSEVGTTRSIPAANMRPSGVSVGAATGDEVDEVVASLRTQIIQGNRLADIFLLMAPRLGVRLDQGSFATRVVKEFTLEDTGTGQDGIGYHVLGLLEAMGVLERKHPGDAMNQWHPYVRSVFITDLGRKTLLRLTSSTG